MKRAGNINLVILALILPLAAAVMLLGARWRDEIAAASLIVDGLTHQRAIRQVLEPIMAHRGSAGLALRGDLAARLRMPGLEQKADRAMRELQNIDPSAAALEEEWSRIEGKWPTMTPGESFDIHNALVARLLEASARSAETSAFSRARDPSIDLLLDALGYRLLALADVDGQIRAHASAAALKRSAEGVDRDVLVTLLERSELMLEAIVADYRRAGFMDPARPSGITSAGREFIDHASNFLKLVREGVLGGTVSAPHDRIWAQGTSTVAAALALYDKSSATAAALLHAEIQLRRRLVALCAAVFAAMSLLAIWIGSRVRGRIVVMAGELNRFAVERGRLQATERERLERLVAERTQEIEQGREMFKLIAESTGATPFKLDLDRRQFQYVSTHIDQKHSMSLSKWAEEGALEALCPRGTNGELRRRLDECGAGRFEFEGPLCRPNETSPMVLRIVGTCEATAQGRYLLGLMQDVTALRRDDRERSAAQKLESVGRLAAGIAHEINTPLQYVNDNVRFLQSSFENLGAALVNYRNLESAVEAGAGVAAAAKVARASAQSIDIDFLMENTSPAVSEALSGLDRITAIVRSMKEFAHPDSAQKAIADLNQAIKNTLVVANSEYKYAADVEEQFGTIPQVRCHLGQINQVVLNLIINASHAMTESAKLRNSRGTLSVRTRQVDDCVEIAIGDNGAGIPEAVRDKLFDPFFTTKGVGVGTGQGLAIARDIVVNKHGGTLSFESQLGKGTTFFIRLPINTPAETAAVEERAA